MLTPTNLSFGKCGHASSINMGIWGIDPSNPLINQENVPGDSHLRSCRKLCDYTVAAEDSSVGQLEDFQIESATWEIRHLVVRPKELLRSNPTLIAPRFVRSIDWQHKRIEVNPEFEMPSRKAS